MERVVSAPLHTAASGAGVFPVVPAPYVALVIPVVALVGMGFGLWWTWRNPGAPDLARWVMAGSFVLVLVALGAAAAGTRTARAEVGPAGLRLRGDVWGRTVPAAVLRADLARVVDLHAERGLRPTLRTMGTGLPGYGAGWFRLADGSRALIYLTERRRVAYLPTTAGYAVLVSAADAEGLVAAVRALPGTAR